MGKAVHATLRPYPLCKMLGGPRGRSGRVWKISPTPGLDSRTVQPVASRYTDYAIPTQFPDSSFTRRYIISEADTESLYILITTYFLANTQSDEIKVAGPPRKIKTLSQSRKHTRNFTLIHS
jgi:hypothetical protein